MCVPEAREGDTDLYRLLRVLDTELRYSFLLRDTKRTPTRYESYEIKIHVIGVDIVFVPAFSPGALAGIYNRAEMVLNRYSEQSEVRYGYGGGAEPHLGI